MSSSICKQHPISYIKTANYKNRQHRNLPDNAMIRLIASRVFAESPSQLFETCEYWTQAVEAAVVANRPIDNRVMVFQHESWVEAHYVPRRGAGSVSRSSTA
ncbi:hypothetical protein OOU_Y34scaffold00820g6 [Pyricularia oryzae Y34]|uniref:Uncharacterized protein n=1 Tax=Pyricularia oryzae (strain Y34) TaxID=1143189 RepID=A0AA97PGT4_PYRO3|nr:hypothetical protein OOU_Y34scaffold00820g6 [Pyricularia oryzae Y34]